MLHFLSLIVIVSEMEINRFKTEILPLRAELLGYAKRIVGNIEDAEDIVQEVLLKLWFMRSDLRRYNSIPALSYVITKNLSLNQIKTSRRKSSTLVELSQESGSGPEKQLQEKESVKNVIAIIDKLPGLQQAIMRMRHLEGMEIEEIAQLTGCSPEAIRMNISRARKRIKELFFEQNNFERNR